MNRFRSIFSNINRQQGGFLNTATRSTRTNKHSTNTIWKPKKASSHNYYSTNSKGKVKSIHNVDESVVDIEHRRKLYSLKTFSLALVPIITFGLGYWQYKRLGWKQDLLDFVNGRIHKPPVVFTGTEGVSSTDIEYLKFRMFGTFDHQNEMRVGPITKDGTLGFNIITPFILDSDGKPTPQDPSLELVPSHIGRPAYSRTGIPSTDFNTSFADTFAPLSESDLLKLKHSCKLAADTLRYSGTLVKEGVTTLEIDTLVRKFIIENEAYPSPLNYYGFPKSICTSINNIVAHGIPDKRKLMDGDIINIDISVYCNGFHGDTSATFCVGNVDQKGLALVEATKKALDIGMNVCGPEVELRQIGNSIENYANEAGYSVNDQYTGHGIGKEFHQNPLIYHFKNDEPGVMKEGMSFMNLSSARSIVGHKNISPDQYDMRIKALTCVDIGDSNTILLKSELPKINKTFGGSTIHQKGSGDSTKVGNELNGQSQTLRNRKNKKDAQPEAEKKKITDPITMFGLLPPKPLKDSQAVFQSSLEEIIELANLQVKLMEKREYVTELKQKLKNLP
ncbi:Methionine aminopeptidase 1B, chloroplastic [Zancudomyces culisetae]|uniref:Multifunctional fusion protein n=1 Tax=Zancudomyces culisetae TaxID=1213189 RepID=A0A1R1PJJ3_ZANCU|nr:Methionine aminopeptidase 1B, chloroplastic [Zancudomyces culisetae]|eukprot:OMH81107.1 Methionine aminopeptidase 1B, chloroplastic [Zancudomyces culisetae]